MTKIVKLHRGLDINLKGAAAKEKQTIQVGGVYALQPDDFQGVKPKVVVKEGDKVKAGDALFINKAYPEVKFASPVSGTMTLVDRGDRRKGRDALFQGRGDAKRLEWREVPRQRRPRRIGLPRKPPKVERRRGACEIHFRGEGD